MEYWVLQKPGPRYYSKKEARSLGAAHAWTEKLPDADQFMAEQHATDFKDKYHLDDDALPRKKDG